MQMACEMEGEKDSRELLLASISRADQLTAMINDSLSSTSVSPLPHNAPTEEPLRIIEEGDDEKADEAASAGEDQEASSAEVASKPELTVTMSAQQLLRISSKLNEQLTQLLVSAVVFPPTLSVIICLNVLCSW